MLFDLRVVLAACLTTLLFVAAGVGLIASSRSPFKVPAGYARNEGPGLAGPGLPKSRPLPVLEEAKPEVTGTIAEAAPEPEAKPEPALLAPARAAKEKGKPGSQLSAKKQSIKALIEEDKAQQESAAPANEAAKKAEEKKKPVRHVRHRAKQPPKQNNPFSLFTNNNTATTTR
jgi:hypothetical protein